MSRKKLLETFKQDLIDNLEDVDIDSETPDGVIEMIIMLIEILQEEDDA